MRRLYLLVPDLESCRVIVDELKGNGIVASHLHVVASLSEHLDGLPEATAWQKTEIAHGIWIGIVLGGVAGLLASMLALTIPPPGMEIGVSAVLGSTVAGAGFGALASAFMKGHEHNRKLVQFDPEIEAGKLLLMVDVARSEVDATQQIIRKHHPEARIEVLKSRR